MARAYDWLNQAPWLIITRNIEVEEGKKAVEDMNIPADRTKKANVNLPTLTPTSFATLW